MTTYPSLLEQFLHEECTPHVRKLICDAVAGREPARQRQEFELNSFNLALDFEAGRATLEDETDATPSGSVDLALADLLAALQCGDSDA
jgi:hypothetical protein